MPSIADLLPSLVGGLHDHAGEGFLLSTPNVSKGDYMIAKGKHELKTHIPQRTYQYLKKHAEGHGIGQLIADMADCYEALPKMARQMEVQSNLVQQILQMLEANNAS
jgi:hypothetical protein